MARITFYGRQIWPFNDDPFLLAPRWAVALHHDLSHLKRQMEKMMTDVSKLQASATALEAKVDGLLAQSAATSVALKDMSAQLKTVSDQLAAVIAANDPTAQKIVQDAIDSVVAGLDAESAKIDAANPPAA